ncbi:MAG TPA: aminotransferase class III-fold pyridoxal phosphate-dependent enzyme, partial [Chloroflexota bacterium]|nr:aminotransferase class III-fold pyridoxal phosphate-dependent enzyme [Chloroflexota bacterium]
RRLLDGLKQLADHPNVGDVRGLGMMAAVELVADKATRASFDPAAKVGERVTDQFRKRGLYTRARGDVICLAPPLVTTEEQIDRLVQVVSEAIQVATASVRS